MLLAVWNWSCCLLCTEAVSDAIPLGIQTTPPDNELTAIMDRKPNQRPIRHHHSIQLLLLGHDQHLLLRRTPRLPSTSAYPLAKPIPPTFHDTDPPIRQDDWEPNFREPMAAFLNTSFLFRYFPSVRSLVHIAPFLAPYMSGDIGILMKELYISTPEPIVQARKDYEAGVERDRPSIFTDILASSLPEEEKTVERLSGEGFSLTGAGTETTAVS